MSTSFKTTPKELKETVDEIITYIDSLKFHKRLKSLGYILSTLSIMAIKYHEGVEPTIKKLAVDNNGVLYVNVDFWKSLTPKQKAFVLLHEALHIASNDPNEKIEFVKPYENVDPVLALQLNYVFNAIHDAINNEHLLTVFKLEEQLNCVRFNDIIPLFNKLEEKAKLPKSTATSLMKMSKRELLAYYDLLVRKAVLNEIKEEEEEKKPPPSGDGGIPTDKEQEEKEEGEGEGGVGEGEEKETGEGRGEGEGEEDEYEREKEKRGKGDVAGRREEAEEEEGEEGKEREGKPKEGKERREGEDSGEGEEKEDKDKGEGEKKDVKDFLKKYNEKINKHYKQLIDIWKKKEKIGEDVATSDKKKEIEKRKDVDVYSEPVVGDLREKLTKIKQILEAMKSAGMGDASTDNVLEFVNQGLKGYIDWKSLLRNLIQYAISRGKRITTWTKEHRYLPLMRPKVVRVKTPKIFILVDISGSMITSIDKVMNEIFNACDLDTPVYVVGWDTKVRWVKQMSKLERDRIDINFTAGNTELLPSLKQFRELNIPIDKDDVLVIITDGLVSDNHNELKKQLQELGTLFKTKIFASPIKYDYIPDTWNHVSIPI